ncbi:transposase family protein [Streptomyces sp. NPDC003631]
MSCEADLGPRGLFPSCPVRRLTRTFRRVVRRARQCVGGRAAVRAPRGPGRRRAEGGGRKPKLVFLDRLLVTLVHLRHQLPHMVLAELFEVDRSTVSAAIRQVRPLLAARGFAVPDRPGPRLKTLGDVFAHAEAEGVELRLDGAETQVRRPQADRPGRRAFVSGKRKQNTIKTTTFSDGQGRLLLSGVVHPGRMHDQTAVRTEGIAEQFRIRLGVKAKVDSATSGWPKNSPARSAPPPRSSPADPRSGQPAAGRAPNSSSSATPPADHPPAEPPGEHARSSISPETVTGDGASQH